MLCHADTWWSCVHPLWKCDGVCARVEGQGKTSPGHQAGSLKRLISEIMQSGSQNMGSGSKVMEFLGQSREGK